MKVISLDESKEIQLSILKFLKQVCLENNLKWFLGYGTLIGAIRHKGYIPWDDDIDIVMPRSDYMKFIELIKNKERYVILNPYDYDDYNYLFSKLVDTRTVLYENQSKTNSPKMGVGIDIFPLDGLPENYNEIEKHFYKLSKLNSRYINSIVKMEIHGVKNKVKQIIKIPYIIYCKLVGTKHWKKLILDSMETYHYDNSNFVGFMVSMYGIKQVFNRQIFADSVDVEFEGGKYPAPIGYEEFLTVLYGDFMKLPPENERVNHGFEAYWREDANNN
jgi:lipopolysaccharide cholinephosphotransferase